MTGCGSVLDDGQIQRDCALAEPRHGAGGAVDVKALIEDAVDERPVVRVALVLGDLDAEDAPPVRLLVDRPAEVGADDPLRDERATQRRS